MRLPYLLCCASLVVAACQTAPAPTPVEPLDPWESAIASISDLDQSPHYRGMRIEVQLGLVPIGRDPLSGFWEFGHHGSGSVPYRDKRGLLELGTETGLVFILMPGGDFLKGAQRTDPSAPGYDENASEWEAPVRKVNVEPFFISKFEMTAAQWRKIRGEMRPKDKGRMPVFQVSWHDCSQALSEAGLFVPTSNQWEYAARGATVSPWSTGDSQGSLEGAENILDEASLGVVTNNEGQLVTVVAPWNDGYPRHAPVGSFRPNPFGLYDVHGNAFEWCRDTPDPGTRTVRGGGSYVIPELARVSIEWSREPEFRSWHLSVRPAYEITVSKQR